MALYYLPQGRILKKNDTIKFATLGANVRAFINIFPSMFL